MPPFGMPFMLPADTRANVSNFVWRRRRRRRGRVRGTIGVGAVRWHVLTGASAAVADEKRVKLDRKSRGQLERSSRAHCKDSRSTLNR